MKTCCMCKQEFKEEELDFLGRCPGCFRNYLELPDSSKPDMGVPWSKKIRYN